MTGGATKHILIKKKMLQCSEKTVYIINSKN